MLSAELVTGSPYGVRDQQRYLKPRIGLDASPDHPIVKRPRPTIGPGKPSTVVSVMMPVDERDSSPPMKVPSCSQSSNGRSSTDDATNDSIDLEHGARMDDEHLSESRDLNDSTSELQIAEDNVEMLLNASLELEQDQNCLENGVAASGGNFSCTQCNKYFWTESQMRHHYSLYHSEKAFVCEICGKAFRFRSNLAEHRSVHTALKPYVCKYCGKSSRLKGNLTKHILKHHKVETNAVVGKEDIIIKKGKKNVKDPKCIDFLERSMIVLDNSTLNTSIPTTTMTNCRKRSFPESINTTNSNVQVKDLQQPPPLHQERKVSSHLESIKSENCSDNSNKQLAGLSIDQLILQAKHFRERAVQNSMDKIIESALQSGQMANLNALSASMAVQNTINPQVQTSIAASLLESALNCNSAAFDPHNLRSNINGGLYSMPSAIQNSRLLEERTLAALRDFATPPTTSECSTLSEGNRTPVSDTPPPSSGNRGSASPSTGSGTQCTICNKHFRKSSQLECHLRMKHSQTEWSGSQSVAVSNNHCGAGGATLNGITLHRSVLENGLADEMHKLPTPTPFSYDRDIPRATTLITNSCIETSIPSISNRFWPCQPRQCAELPTTLAVSPTNHHSASDAVSVATSSLSCFTEKLSTLNGCTKDIREIRELLLTLKQLCMVSSPKVESLLVSLDNQVSRVERQMETSLGTLGTLIQVQTSLNLALCQFKDEITQKVTAIVDQLKCPLVVNE